MSDNDKLNVLHITSSFPYSGNPVYGIFVRDLVDSICDHVNISVLSPHFDDTVIYEKKSGYKIYTWYQCCPPRLKLAGNPGGILPALKKNQILWLFVPLFLISEFFSLAKVIKKEKIHIIHAHWLIPQGLLGAIYKKIFNKNIKLVITCHGSDVNKINRGILNILKRFTLKNADKVFAVSDDLADKIKKIYAQTSCIVQPIGIDTELFSPEAAYRQPDIRQKYGLKSSPVLFVGSLIELKGVRYLVKAWKQVTEHHPEAELLIAGGGELRHELEDLSKSLNIADRVHFAGVVDHETLPAYFAQSVLFVLPSFSEGFSLVNSEALSCGLPSVISRISIFEQLFKDKSFVHFCTPGDPDSIARAIIAELDQGGHKNTEGREWVKQNISLKNTAVKHCTVYKELLRTT